MVPKVFEPLKFYCSYFDIYNIMQNPEEENKHVLILLHRKEMSAVWVRPPIRPLSVGPHSQDNSSEKSMHFFTTT